MDYKVSTFYLALLLHASVCHPERSIQTLIDSGEIKQCLSSNGELALAHKELQSLKGLENVAQAASIKFIDLSHNQISELTGCSFEHFGNLTQLWLNDNLLEDISALTESAGLGNLRELHVTHNKLHELDLQQLSTLPMLYILNVGFNEIKIVKPKKCWGLNNLEMLFLNNNKLTTLPSYVFSACPNVQAIYLHGNTLNHLEPHCLDGLYKMRLLYLQDNALTHLASNIFINLKSLHILYLRNNAIAQLEMDWAKGLDQLNILDLSHNRLSEVDIKNSGIDSLKSLKNFYV